MRIWDQQGFIAEYTTAQDKASVEYILVIAKASYDFPASPNEPVLKSKRQAPLVAADIATGEPGFSATLWESDFAFRKPRCDVIANGYAYAPMGRAAEQVRVGIQIGQWSKQFDVIGDREWRAIGPTFRATQPERFLRESISYDRAWGGVDPVGPGQKPAAVYPLNPVGTGWASTADPGRIHGLRLPNTQMPGQEIRSPFGAYKPMSFGPVGRGWPGRLEHAGTYDEKWAAEVFPFLPSDFDDRYFQMAPLDQQIDPPQGGEMVQFVNLTREGRVSFRMPPAALPITLFPRRAEPVEETVFPDTVLFDPENRLLSLVWRIASRLRRSVSDYTECWIGPPTTGMVLAKAHGKRYLRW